MPVTQHPLHGSVRAALPHTAPALGHNEQTLLGVRVADTQIRQPAAHETGHAAPRHAAALAAAAQRAMPQPDHLEPEGAQPRAVERNPEVATMPCHDRSQVLTLCGDRQVHSPSEFMLDRC